MMQCMWHWVRRSWDGGSIAGNLEYSNIVQFKINVEQVCDSDKTRPLASWDRGSMAGKLEYSNCSPLHRLVLEGNLSGVVDLLDSDKSSLDRTCRRGSCCGCSNCGNCSSCYRGWDITALYLACEAGHSQIALRLLKSGADPNIMSLHDWPNMFSDDYYTYSPLKEAKEKGLTEVCRMLVAKGAKMK